MQTLNLTPKMYDPRVNPPKIRLGRMFNLTPEIKVIVDKVNIQDSSFSKSEGIFKKYATSYDISDCVANLRLKTVWQGNCSTLSFDFVDSQSFNLIHEGDRIRLYLDGIAHFCGIVFCRDFSPTKISITCFDYLRYFKSTLSFNKDQMMSHNSKTGLTIDGVFTRVCMDLFMKNQLQVISTSDIPVPAQRYDMKTGFYIMDFAVSHTLITSPDDNKEYFIYYHDPYFEDDDFSTESQLYKTSGSLKLDKISNLTTDVVITDDSLLNNYEFKSSIDTNTFNFVVVYNDKKTYLSPKGKTLKNGKKTGTRKQYDFHGKSVGIYGYLPYYHKAPDSWTEAELQQQATRLLNILDRPSQSISLECYGILGMRAGYMVPVAIEKLGDTSVGIVETDENGETVLLPGYRVVKECEMIIEHPLKMNIVLGAGQFTETS